MAVRNVYRFGFPSTHPEYSFSDYLLAILYSSFPIPTSLNVHDKRVGIEIPPPFATFTRQRVVMRIHPLGECSSQFMCGSCADVVRCGKTRSRRCKTTKRIVSIGIVIECANFSIALLLLPIHRLEVNGECRNATSGVGEFKTTNLRDPCAIYERLFNHCLHVRSEKIDYNHGFAIFFA